MRLIRTLAALYMLRTARHVLDLAIYVAESNGPRSWQARCVGPVVLFGVHVSGCARRVAPWIASG